MILLNNYSRKNTFICITEEMYTVIEADVLEIVENGEGGFSEDNELLGLYVKDGKLYFQYNNKCYEADASEIYCTNEWIDGGKRQFIVQIKRDIVCNIIYKPYLSPLALVFEDDEDEFDFLLYLSKIMESEKTIRNFMKGMENLKKMQ